ncbi:MAG: serine hydrolase domain-containing protein [Acidimicrobiia bacterium]
MRRVAVVGLLALAVLPVALVAGAPGAGAAKSTSACVADVAKVTGTVPDAAAASATLPKKLVAKLDAAAQASFEVAAAPGAIVGVRTPKGTWINAYGEADPTTGAPMTTDMHMRIGSVTKTVTGTVILQLAEQGKLSLDDPIEKYVSGIPNGSDITLRMLANMTSGIASYYTDPFLDRYFANPQGAFTPSELVAYGVTESPIFAPGKRFDYSNTNTVLLGQVIEKVTGRPVADVLAENITGPLQLTGTVWPEDSTVIPAPYANGYTLQGGGDPANPTDATNWNPSFGWTAGAYISTVADMLNYDEALATGHGLVSTATQKARLKSFPKPAGYGFAIGCSDGWIGHTGELPGYNTTVYYDTTSATAVVVMVNSDIKSGNCPDSPTLTDTPRELVCSSPATRVFVGVSKALGHEFQPNPAR